MSLLTLTLQKFFAYLPGGEKREETAVVEDTYYALETAKNDGFVTIAVFDDLEKAQSEMRSLADYYLTDLADSIIK